MASLFRSISRTTGRTHRSLFQLSANSKPLSPSSASPSPGSSRLNKLALVVALGQLCSASSSRAASTAAMASAGDQRTFQLSDSSRLVIVKGDLTTMEVDAIVNAANEGMLGGGGVDGAIHRAAGPDLYDACLAVPQVRRGVRCPTGEARITGGFNLPAKHVIHTVGPIYDSPAKSAPLLANAYKSSLTLANEHNLKTVAFCAISTGVYGYPIDEAAEVALDAVAKAVGQVQTVYFVLFQPAHLSTFLATAARKFQETAPPAPPEMSPVPEHPRAASPAASAGATAGAAGAGSSPSPPPSLGPKAEDVHVGAAGDGSGGQAAPASSTGAAPSGEVPTVKFSTAPESAASVESRGAVVGAVHEGGGVAGDVTPDLSDTAATTETAAGSRKAEL